ncbi:MAG: aminoacyl-tRNA hydrolase [Chloroflexi bacterium]|nr:aminoacyl-tRNA hydrolase [Chloroflexota bacterium]
MNEPLPGTGPSSRSVQKSGFPISNLTVVGLGNPGQKYTSTRHNAGAMAVERLAKKHAIAIATRRGESKIGRGQIDGNDVTLALPLTFMNVSGEAVAPLVRRDGSGASKILIVYDDVDLPLGRIRLRPDGSAGGHNGMRSVIASLGSDRFPRLRIGVGRPEAAGQNTIAYVIGQFRPDEASALDAALQRAVACMELLVTEGLERAMNAFN